MAFHKHNTTTVHQYIRQQWYTHTHIHFIDYEYRESCSLQALPFSNDLSYTEIVVVSYVENIIFLLCEFRVFYFSCFLFIIFVRHISRALVLCRNSPHSSTCLMTTQFKIMLIENTTLYTQSDNDSLLLASLPSLFCRYCCSCSFCSFHFLVNFFLTCLRFSFYVDTFCPRRMMSKHAM